MRNSSSVLFTAFLIGSLISTFFAVKDGDEDEDGPEMQAISSDSNESREGFAVEYLGQGADSVTFSTGPTTVAKFFKQPAKHPADYLVGKELSESGIEHFSTLTAMTGCTDEAGIFATDAYKERTIMCAGGDGSYCYLTEAKLQGTTFPKQFASMCKDGCEASNVADIAAMTLNMWKEIAVALKKARDKIGFRHHDMNFRNVYVTSDFVPTIFDYGAAVTTKLNADIVGFTDVDEGCIDAGEFRQLKDLLRANMDRRPVEVEQVISLAPAIGMTPAGLLAMTPASASPDNEDLMRFVEDCVNEGNLPDGATSKAKTAFAQFKSKVSATANALKTLTLDQAIPHLQGMPEA